MFCVKDWIGHCEEQWKPLLGRGVVAVACTKVVPGEGIEEKTVWEKLREGTVGLVPFSIDCTMENITSSILVVISSSCASVCSATPSGVAGETCSFPGPSL